MPIPSTQLLDDRDRQFDDWGETITFREVIQSYQPDSQTVSETTTDTELVAIVETHRDSPTPGTATQHLTGEISFLIKAEDLPTAGPEPTSRVLYNGGEYDILKFVLSPQGLIYTLHCRRTS